MMAASALALVLIAFPLQLLGLTSTCTQGADGTFGSGAILSGPPLLVAALLTAMVALRLPHGRRTWLVMIGAAAAVLVSLTRSAWFNSLAYGTPCGADFAFYGSHTVTLVAIAVSYLVLPLAIVALAVLGVTLQRQN
jgi:hypothetical protein